jgi:hypothetical protein
MRFIICRGVRGQPKARCTSCGVAGAPPLGQGRQDQLPAGRQGRGMRLGCGRHRWRWGAGRGGVEQPLTLELGLFEQV